MSKKVIGYTQAWFVRDFEIQGISDLSELVGAKATLNRARVVADADGKKKLKNDNDADDIFFQMLHANAATITEAQEGCVTFIFDNPIPEDVFIEYYGNHNTIIYAQD